MIGAPTQSATDAYLAQLEQQRRLVALRVDTLTRAVVDPGDAVGWARLTELGTAATVAGQDVTVVTGDLLSVKRTPEGAEATYDPERFAAILKAIGEDRAFSRDPTIAVLSDTHATVDGLLAAFMDVPTAAYAAAGTAGAALAGGADYIGPVAAVGEWRLY